MKHRYAKICRAFLVSAVLALPVVQGCATEQNPRVDAAVDDQPFQAWLNGLVSQIDANPRYKRLPLDTTDSREAFLVLLHDTYHHRVSKEEFSQRVNSQFPSHQYETSFIVSRLP
ncbi:hypothetical protein DDE05_08950 [Streptomyces cavourensis]|nr:hypothetical protein DDE05_08950 [Streptomyces cavourensis]